MNRNFAPVRLRSLLTLVVLLLASCLPSPTLDQSSSQKGFKVMAVESYLADITQNVAGDRLSVISLIPKNVEPHTFEPTPRDVANIAECDLLVINGGGLETWIDTVLKNTGGKFSLVEASKGLTSRSSKEMDPHFWLDPTRVITYVENIRDGLIQIDPAGKDVYNANAQAYITQLKELDAWAIHQIDALPVEKRLLVTNHESFGYFADHYGFKIIGTIIPGVSLESSPSAQQMASLIDQIRASGSAVIFLETGTNPDLAQQISEETGVRVITDLYTHSLTDASGPAPTYIKMIRYNVETIVAALK